MQHSVHLVSPERLVASLEQRCAAIEKLSDRGWNIGQAAIVSVISMTGGAILSLLIQLALKR